MPVQKKGTNISKCSIGFWSQAEQNILKPGHDFEELQKEKEKKSVAEAQQSLETLDLMMTDCEQRARREADHTCSIWLALFTSNDIVRFGDFEMQTGRQRLIREMICSPSL